MSKEVTWRSQSRKYAAMQGRGPITAAELAEATGAHERFVLEWLRAQAAAEIINYAGDDRFELSDTQASVLVSEESLQRGRSFGDIAGGPSFEENIEANPVGAAAMYSVSVPRCLSRTAQASGPSASTSRQLGV